VKESIHFATTLTLLVTFAFSQPALSDRGKEKIESAFGIKFGQKWEAKAIVGPLQGKRMDMLFAFSPKIKNDNFKCYYVYRTPKSHIVYKIGATDGFCHAVRYEYWWRSSGPSKQKISDCKSKKRAIFDFLKKKYAGDYYEGDALPYSIKQGRSMINIFCGANLNITYHDFDLHILANKEEKEENERLKEEEFQSGSIDPEGL